MKSWHPYTHEWQERATLTLLVLGVGCAWGLSRIFAAKGWTSPWWLDAPSVFGFYTPLAWLFNRWAWRIPPFRWLHGVPDLNGRYRITVRSSHDKLATTKEGTATITQGWKKLVIRTTTENSSSVSAGAWLVDDPGAGDSLTYVFLNTPRAGAAKALETHEGTATVVFTPDGKGTGRYYSGRGRSKHGEITFERAH